MKQVNSLFTARKSVLDRVNDMELVTTEKFAGLDVDFYRSGDDVFMTRKQVGEALGYKNPNDAIRLLHRRNKERMDGFSVSFRLNGTDGKTYDTHLYNEKGIYEILRKSNQPKADEFYDFVYDVIEGLRKGQLTVQPPMTTKELLLRATTEHEVRIEKVESDVHKLINETPIRNHQQAAIEKLRKSKIIKLLGGMNSNAYKTMSRKVFSEIGRDFKTHFNIPRYNELPQSRYEEGMAYLRSWQPSTNTRLLIENKNNQISMDDL